MSHVNRIALVTEPDDPEVKETLAALKRAYGRVPNFYAVLAERIALLAAQSNRCEYCLSAHSAAGRAAGLPADEIAGARIGQSSDRRSAIALRVAQEMLDRAGDVSDETLVAAREEGFGDAELVELLALVASNIFSNYLSRLARTEIDYKRVALDDDIVPANGSSS
jgi:AhpD family alkylhydroperoxidase